jgi:hypothetical protein
MARLILHESLRDVQARLFEEGTISPSLLARRPVSIILWTDEADCGYAWQIHAGTRLIWFSS